MYPQCVSARYLGGFRVILGVDHGFYGFNAIPSGVRRHSDSFPMIFEFRDHETRDIEIRYGNWKTRKKNIKCSNIH